MPWRLRNPGRSLAGVAAYAACASAAHLLCVLLWRYRWFGAHHVPARGPLLVVSNHQSHLDPVLVGLSIHPRQMNFLARAGLFLPVFGALIRMLNAVPLRQGESDTAAIRTALEQLAMGRAVLVFPEGSRTPDGAMHPFKRGVWLLLSRAGCPVLPIAVEGAYDMMPKDALLPRIGGPVAVQIGEPIDAAALKAMGAEAALAHLAERVEALRVDLRARLERSGARLTTKPMSGVGVD